MQPKTGNIKRLLNTANFNKHLAIQGLVLRAEEVQREI